MADGRCALLMSVVSHSMFTLSVYLVARAMFAHVPTLREHLILVPLGMVAGSLPLAPRRIRSLRIRDRKALRDHSGGDQHRRGRHPRGLVYRLLTILVAVMGIVVYWSSRREVQQVLDDVEQVVALERAGMESTERQGS